MIVAIYTRVSGRSNKQDTANQSDVLRAWCQREGHDIIEYSDRMTGTRGDRTALQQMFQDAAEGKFQMLLFWSLDRFSREGTLATLQHLQRLDRLGIVWRSHTESHLDTSNLILKDLLIGLISSLAKMEHARIQERLAAARARMKKEGRSWGRPKRVFDRNAVSELRQQGLSIRQIASKLDVSTGTVQNVLRG